MEKGTIAIGVLKKGAFCLLLVALVFTLSGCWSSRELGELAFVSAVGIDRGDDGELRVTLEMAKPMAIGGEGGRTTEKAYWIAESTGQTVFDAMRNVLKRSTRRPFWQHNRFILMGESVAREGIGPYLDFFWRDGETRTNAFLLIARGAPAGQLIQVEFDADAIPAEGAFGLVALTRQALSKAAPSNLLQVLMALEMKGVEPTTAAVNLYDRRSGQPTEVGNILREGARITTELDSTAVFKGDRLVGWLNDVEGRGLLWATGKARSGIVVIDAPGAQEAKIALEILRSESKMEVEFVDGRAEASIKIEVTAAMGESQVELDPAQADLWRALELLLEEAVAGEITTAVSKAKELGSDIFGFGAALRLSDHKSWEGIADSWDTFFLDTAVQVNVKAKLKHSGGMLRTVRF